MEKLAMFKVWEEAIKHAYEGGLDNQYIKEGKFLRVYWRI